MEKVRISAEQAKRIERLTGPIHIVVKRHAQGTIDYSPLSDLSLDELIKALYIGYEVEPEFKIGDWVYDETFRVVYKIKEIRGKTIVTDSGLADLHTVTDNAIRHATPSEIAAEKERRWWRKHGREVWELRIGDLLKFKYKHVYKHVLFTQNDLFFLSNENGSRTIDDIKEHYNIVAFAQNRLDVKTND